LDLEGYRSSALEQQREADLLELLPGGRSSILEIGARDGHHTQKLTQLFDAVTALDLKRPVFDIPRVTTEEGNVLHLDFPMTHSAVSSVPRCWNMSLTLNAPRLKSSVWHATKC
jgi:protein-L-isoaspartate O-methyltransferase